MAKAKKGVMPAHLRKYAAAKKSAAAKRTGPTPTMPVFLKKKLGRKRG